MVRALCPLFLVALLIAGCPSSTTPVAVVRPEPQLADLGIDVTPDAGRAYFFTDKGDAFYYGEAAGPQRSSFQGFNVRGFVFVDDWQWETAAGNLGSTAFTGATIWPDHAVRRYPGGLSERITLLEGQRVLVVEPTGAGALVLRPMLADSTQAAYYVTHVAGGALTIVRANHPAPLDANDFPAVLVVKAAGATAALEPQLLTGGGLKPKLFSPGALHLPAAEPVVFAVGNTEALATAAADLALGQLASLEAARSARLQALLTSSFVQTSDPGINLAEGWVRLSMDALVMNQQGKGIFAGLPWFNNYWGRDTFISLGGSHLATGQWEEARDILASFATHQDVDLASATYGRIPNTVSLGGVSYNTADGTPWFCIQAASYLLRSGDTAAVATLWPVVQRATDGALEHLDATGFLLHGDQETWMDATGPKGPYTPRGDRAVEIEGLWYQQLRSAAAVADLAGQSAAATSYRAKAAAVAAALLTAFYDPLRVELGDHLRPDGGLDLQVRPNQFIALHAMGDALDAAQVQAMTRSAAERLVYQHGVASLSPLDPFFHPWHLLPGFYPKDEAYHDGVVWEWLSGPLVSLMVDQGAAEKAWELLQSQDGLAASTATVGTLPELMDAVGPPVLGVTPPAASLDPPQPAGTPYQAWSHGEHLRNVYEDFLGVRYLAADHVRLKPALPSAWGAVTARFRLGGGSVKATLTPDGGALDVQLTGEGALPSTAVVTLEAFGRSFDLPMTSDAGQHALVSGTVPDNPAWAGFAWRFPELPAGLATLVDPNLTVLNRDAIKQAPGADARVRLTLTDPAGDDLGPPGQHYLYPLDTHFQPGLFDVRTFVLREDANAFFFGLTFGNLVQPGWNPADGFQLTYAAVLFDTGAPGRTTTVGHKALYELGADAGYQYGLYVGAGFEVQDATGQVLASYTPQAGDVINPLGSVDSKTISFRVPKTVLPALPGGTIVTVLAGSQDDYGNGSMGDFRLVSVGDAGQWAGGGKALGTDPNVYDFATGVVGP